jgi:hypothetical protein
MPINLYVENLTSDSDLKLLFKRGQLRNFLNALEYERDKFIKYAEDVVELKKSLLTENRILNNSADRSKLESIKKQFNHLNVQCEMLIYTLKKFSISLKEFINNPCLATAVNLKDYYEIYNHNIAELNQYSPDYANELESNIKLKLLKIQIKSFGLRNDVLKIFPKGLDELIKKYENLGKFNFKTINYKQWRANINLLNNKSFRALLNNTNYVNNLVGSLRQANNPIIGNGLCAGIALYGVYQSLTTGDVQVEGDLLVSNNKISYVEKCHFFRKKDAINLLPRTKLTGKTPKQASQLIAEKLKIILMNINNREEQYGFALSMKRNCRITGHTLGISKTKEHLFFIDANYGVFKFNIDELEKFCNFISWFLYTTKYCHYFNAFIFKSMPSIEHEFPTTLKLKLDAIPNLLLTSVPISSKNIPKFNKALRFTKNCISKPYNKTRDFLNSSRTVASTLFDYCYNRIR